MKIEPPHGKNNNVAVRPPKTQISRGIRPVTLLVLSWGGSDVKTGIQTNERLKRNLDLSLFNVSFLE